MKLLIVAGGGGHFAPALAVIEALPKDVEILVIGRKYTFEGDATESLEYQTAKKLGIPFQTITTGRLQRTFSRHSLLSVAKVPVGYLQAIKILRNFNPDVVLSFGGYVSIPVAFTAKTLGVPIVVHEQVLGAGLANKIVAKFAQKVCVSWQQSTKFFPKEKVVVTGNPMRKSLPVSENKILRQAQDDKKLIFVTGGSGGAHAINILIEACLEQLLEKYTVIHQAGDAKEFADFDRLEKKKAGLAKPLQERYLLTKFVEPGEVFAILEKAALVVSRSGMNTVTELLSFGKPCLLIPLPYGQHNEQLTNALFVKQTGIGEVAEQKDLTGEKLFRHITKMIEHLDEYKKHSAVAQKLLITDSAKQIISVLEDVNKQAKITKS